MFAESVSSGTDTFSVAYRSQGGLTSNFNPASAFAKCQSRLSTKLLSTKLRVTYNRIAGQSAERLPVLDQFCYAISPRIGRVRPSE